jgi:8-oxo-dGTP diphosphatase
MSETENTSSEELQFVYRKELWFANALLNSTKFDIPNLVKELVTFIKNKLKDITESDIPNCAWSKEVQNKVLEIAKNIDLKIDWISVLNDFPYKKDKITFNCAGYFEFDVEYFKKDPEKKIGIKPWILHEVPVYILTLLKQFFSKYDHVKLDNDPMYIVAIADHSEERGLPVEVPWTKKEIESHKKCISQWVSLYSGRWDDFRDTYLTETIQNNIALRKTELHYIRDESAFFYISKSDFEEYFESYYKSRIIRTIGEIRAFQNAIITLNQSTDELKTNINTAAFFKIEFVSGTVSQLEYLIGVIDSKISTIKNDLESNRYRYYKKVLLHVFDIMDIELLTEQLHLKLNQVSSSLQNRYREEQKKSQDQLEKSTNNLNIIFGLGILADLVALATTFIVTLKGDVESRNPVLWISGIVGSLCLLLLIGLLARLVWINRGNSQPMQTVDAIIIDKKDRLILVKRKFQPFKGAYALPGGFTELAEDKAEALVREVREETGVDLNYGEWKNIGVFDKPGRDPRGPVSTTAFLCQIDDIQKRSEGYTDEERLVIVDIADLKKMKLAFDHREIINKALKSR